MESFREHLLILDENVMHRALRNQNNPTKVVHALVNANAGFKKKHGEGLFRAMSLSNKVNFHIPKQYEKDTEHYKNHYYNKKKIVSNKPNDKTIAGKYSRIGLGLD